MLIAADMVAASGPARIAAGRGSETMRARGSRSVLGLIHFDPQRRAVFLAGGDKAGKWSDWYKTAIPQAEQAYAEHPRHEEKK